MNFTIWQQLAKTPVTAQLALAAVIGLASLPSVGRADTFICESVDQDSQIVIDYGAHGPTQQGAAIAESMIVNDLSVSPADQNVATFRRADGLLETSGSIVLAKVDLNNSGSSRSGERVGGTTLGSLQSIQLNIDFTYQEPVASGGRFAAEALFLKIDGEELTQDFDCVNSPTVGVR